MVEVSSSQGASPSLTTHFKPLLTLYPHILHGLKHVKRPTLSEGVGLHSAQSEHLLDNLSDTHLQLYNRVQTPWSSLPPTPPLAPVTSPSRSSRLEGQRKAKPTAANPPFILSTVFSKQSQESHVQDLLIHVQSLHFVTLCTTSSPSHDAPIHCYSETTD